MVQVTKCALTNLAVILMLLFTTSKADLDITTIHPDWDLLEVPLQQDYVVMGMDFLSDGRLVLSTIRYVQHEMPARSDSAEIIILDNITGRNMSPTAKSITSMWIQPGGITVENDEIYVADREAFFQILDIEDTQNRTTNRNKIMDWPDEGTWNDPGRNMNGYRWHEWVFTPIYKDGWFYGSYSGSLHWGGEPNIWEPPTTSFSGSWMRWNVNGDLERISAGMRSPNGFNVNAKGEMFFTDNQGDWLPSSTFNFLKPNRFYGHKAKEGSPGWAEDLPRHLPTAWLPHGVVRNSPSEPLEIKKGLFKGDWIIGDVTNRGMIRVYLDSVKDYSGEDDYNGAVFWFTQGMGTAAINRLEWGPDDAIYVGTCQFIRGGWPYGNYTPAPMYKMILKDSASAFEMKSVRLLEDGFEIEFTQEVQSNLNTSDFTVTQWKYRPTSAYGCCRETDLARTVSQVEISEDKKRVHINLNGLDTNMVTHIKIGGIQSASQQDLYDDEVWYTLNYPSTRKWDPKIPIKKMIPKSSNLVKSIGSNNGFLKIQFSKQIISKIELRELNGTKVSEIIVKDSSVKFILPKIKGLYLIRIINSDGLIFSNKIISSL